MTFRTSAFLIAFAVAGIVLGQAQEETPYVSPSASDSCPYYVFDSLQGRELARFQAHPAVARCADFSPDGKTLVTSGDDGLIRLWHVETGRPQ